MSNITKQEKLMPAERTTLGTWCKSAKDLAYLALSYSPVAHKLTFNTCNQSSIKVMN